VSRTGSVQDGIVRAAAVCFGEMGYRAATLDRIAARAGLSKVTLYRYVRSKEELLCRVFERTIEAFRTGLAEIVRQDVADDEKLRRIVRYQVALLAGHLPFLTVFFGEESGLPAAMARRVRRAKREYDLTLERVLRDGMKRGLVRELPPRLVVFAMLGMCNWLHKWYRADGPLQPAEIADVFVDLLERGYLAAGRARESGAGAAALARIERRLARLERRLAVAARAGRRPAGRRS